jgi:hypothetical protein
LSDLENSLTEDEDEGFEEDEEEDYEDQIVKGDSDSDKTFVEEKNHEDS